jgi:nucleoside-diphosphate-sugar epimerase
LYLVEAINKILGKNIAPKLLPVRAGDVFRTNADIRKIKTVLGYGPKVDFEEGLSRTVEYFRKIYGK